MLNQVQDKTIVIVEDDEAINDSLATYLGRRNKVQAFTSAELLLNATPPVEKVDLFIIDYKLPGQNGVELFQHLRGTSPKSKFILITGEMNYEVAERTRDLGPDALILKPFDYRILEDNIAGLVSNSS